MKRTLRAKFASIEMGGTDGNGSSSGSEAGENYGFERDIVETVVRRAFAHVGECLTASLGRMYRVRASRSLFAVHCLTLADRLVTVITICIVGKRA